MKGTVKYGKVKQYFLDGKEVTEAQFEAAFPPVYESSGSGKPGSSLVGWTALRSESTAYHPSQVKEATEFLASKGVPTEIDRMGRPIFRSRGHRRQFMKLNKQHDNDGGYGDG